MPIVEEEADAQENGKFAKHQESRMKICSYYFVALELAKTINDTQIMADTIMKIYNCIAPILTEKKTHPFLVPKLLLLVDSLKLIDQFEVAKQMFQKIAASILSISAKICVEYNKIEQLQKCATIFHQVFRKIKLYVKERTEKDVSSALKVEPELDLLVEVFFLQPKSCDTMITFSSESDIYDEIYFAVCPLLHSDPMKAADALSKFKEHPKYDYFISILCSKFITER